jgi:hypothetical protein
VIVIFDRNYLVVAAPALGAFLNAWNREPQSSDTIPKLLAIVTVHVIAGPDIGALVYITSLIVAGWTFLHFISFASDRL